MIFQVVFIRFCLLQFCSSLKACYLCFVVVAYSTSVISQVQTYVPETIPGLEGQSQKDDRQR